MSKVNRYGPAFLLRMIAAKSRSVRRVALISQLLRGDREQLEGRGDLHQMIGREAVGRAGIDLRGRVGEGKVARGVELAAVVVVKQIAADMVADGMRHRLIRGEHIDDETELVRRDLPLRLKPAHHAVSA